MRLDSRQVRFVAPFWPTMARKVRLAGRRGMLHLQETALVAEGELIRFSFFGVEWLFRRALSEWTTVTVPYSRIAAVKYRRLLLLRIVSVLVVLAGIALTVYGFMVERDLDGTALVGSFTLILAFLLGYINLRVRPYYRVMYRGKDERRYLLTFAVRVKRLRKPFLDTLASHRVAAATFAGRSGEKERAST